jgi:mitosis inhibitor protein kinase SWE1
MFSSEWPSPTGCSSPGPVPVATDDEEMGEITDEDDEGFPDMAMIADMDEEPVKMDEEDLFFGSGNFNASARSDEGLGTDPEDSFSWGSTSAPANASFFAINVTESTPSPRGKKVGSKMLEKKYKPRDSGISLTDEEDGGPHAPVRGLAPPRAGGRGFGIGRSGSVSIVPPPPLTTSTSASTVASSEDMELFTPGFGPSMSSGWPGIVSTSASDVDGLGLVSAFQTDSEVDAFILRTLLQAQSVDASSSTTAKRPPGTPQKRTRAAVGSRPWQSAFATKVGFDFGVEDSDGGGGGSGVGAGEKDVKNQKKKPRKSLPAAFPVLGGTARRKSIAAANARSREDTEDESDASPSGHGKERYEGLGLGRPSAARTGRTPWLMRRSSSGAMSASGSHSGEGSWPATPTAGNKNGSEFI